MIYVVVFTQVLTLAAAIFIAIAARNYLERERALEASVLETALQQQLQANESAQKTVREVVAASDARVQKVLEQAHKEREMLLERIQQPEMTAGQMHLALGEMVRQSGPKDENEEWELEHGGQPADPEAAVEAPTKELPKPVQPITPYGKRDRNGS